MRALLVTAFLLASPLAFAEALPATPPSPLGPIHVPSAQTKAPHLTFDRSPAHPDSERSSTRAILGAIGLMLVAGGIVILRATRA